MIKSVLYVICVTIQGLDCSLASVLSPGALSLTIDELAEGIILPLPGAFLSPLRSAPVAPASTKSRRGAFGGSSRLSDRVYTLSLSSWPTRFGGTKRRWPRLTSGALTLPPSPKRTASPRSSPHSRGAFFVGLPAVLQFGGENDGLRRQRTNDRGGRLNRVWSCAPSFGT
jgi:hypothetical protein